MRTAIFSFLFIITLFPFAWNRMQAERSRLLETTELGYTIPSSFSVPMALRFKGILSDFLFLKTTTAIGEQLQKKIPFEESHKEFIVSSTHVITDLDPRFWDPYLFAGMTLTWDYKDFPSANYFFSKAMHYAPEDWQPPYFIGFNCFYFMNDIACGTEYISLAARKKQAPAYLPHLASRLAMFGDSYQPVLVMLKQLIVDTPPGEFQAQLRKRLTAIETLAATDSAIEKYKALHQGSLPTSIAALVTAGLLPSLPKDPFGGEIYISKTGRALTTSRLIPVKNK